MRHSSFSRAPSSPSAADTWVATDAAAAFLLKRRRRRRRLRLLLHTPSGALLIIYAWTTNRRGSSIASYSRCLLWTNQLRGSYSVHLCLSVCLSEAMLFAHLPLAIFSALYALIAFPRLSWINLSARTNSPCFGLHVKYVLPCTVPSFFPVGVSSSMPIQTPPCK